MYDSGKMSKETVKEDKDIRKEFKVGKAKQKIRHQKLTRCQFLTLQNYNRKIKGLSAAISEIEINIK